MRGRCAISGTRRLCAPWPTPRPTLPQPLLEARLALAATGSVRRDDLMPDDATYCGRRGQTCAVRHCAAHRRARFPGRRHDEVIVFMHSDSAAQPEATPHTDGETRHFSSVACHVGSPARGGWGSYRMRRASR